jgi:hypothetical protein
MTDKPQQLTEDCLVEFTGGFGFRAVFSYYEHWTDLKVYEITSRTIDGMPSFDRAGATSWPDPVDSIDDAEIYLKGYIKWDGCSELDQGCPHWCGPRDYKKHIALLEHLYRRSQELMTSGNWEPWDG